MKFAGEACSKCGEIFNENDDVVVCPECGSPHHRICYGSECANASLHGTDYKWQKKIVSIKSGSEKPRVAVRCPDCGAVSDSTLNRCPGCGTEFTDELIEKSRTDHNKALHDLFKLEPDFTFEGIPVPEVIFFLRSNVMYYLNSFCNIAKKRKNISFNLICFIFPPIYFANRRMWFWAVLTTIISVILSLPLAVTTIMEMSIDGSARDFFSAGLINVLSNNENILMRLIEICNTADFIFRFILCIFANRIYYRHTIRSIKILHNYKKNVPPTPQELRSIGGVRPLNTVIAVALTFVITFLAMLFSQIILESII
ncbi:MAG: DUF2628 domain-containing protein [Ruminococcus sp.]|nr:DUF2628 domain-containing protein [Ruminococcus sp.]MDE6784645.1 DUF2628 domain-containing protein [Ruminococcus sp.]